jgi:hypothetical protein
MADVPTRAVPLSRGSTETVNVKHSLSALMRTLCNQPTISATSLMSLVSRFRTSKGIVSESSIRLHARCRSFVELRDVTLKAVNKILSTKVVGLNVYRLWASHVPGGWRTKAGISWSSNNRDLILTQMLQILFVGHRLDLGVLSGYVIDTEDCLSLSSVGTADLLIVTDEGQYVAVDLTMMSSIPQSKVDNLARHVTAGFIDAGLIVQYSPLLQEVTMEDIGSYIFDAALPEEAKVAVKLSKLLINASSASRSEFASECVKAAEVTYSRHIVGPTERPKDTEETDQTLDDVKHAQSNEHDNWEYLTRVMKAEDKISAEVSATLESVTVPTDPRPNLIVGELQAGCLSFDDMMQLAIRDTRHEIALSVHVLRRMPFKDGTVYACSSFEDLCNLRIIAVPKMKPYNLESKGKRKMAYVYRHWPLVKGARVDCVFSVGTKSDRFKIVRDPTVYAEVLEKMEGFDDDHRNEWDGVPVSRSEWAKSAEQQVAKLASEAAKPTACHLRNFEALSMSNKLLVEDEIVRAKLAGSIKNCQTKLGAWVDSDAILSQHVLEVLGRSQGRGWFYPSLDKDASLMVLIKTSQNIRTFKDVSFTYVSSGSHLKGTFPGAYSAFNSEDEKGQTGIWGSRWLTLSKNMLAWKVKLPYHLLLRCGMIMEYCGTVREGFAGERLFSVVELALSCLPLLVNRQQFSIVADAVRYSYVGSTGVAVDPKGLFSKMQGVHLKSIVEVAYFIRAVKQHAAISRLTASGKMGRIMSAVSQGMPVVPMPETIHGRYDPVLNTSLIYTKTIMNIEKDHTLAYSALDTLGLIEELDIYNNCKTHHMDHLVGTVGSLAARIRRADTLDSLIGFSRSAVFAAEYNDYVARLAGGKKLRFTWDIVATVAASAKNGSLGSLDAQRVYNDGRSLDFLTSLSTIPFTDVAGTEGSMIMVGSLVKACRKGSAIISLVCCSCTGAVLQPAAAYARLRQACRANQFLSVSLQDLGLMCLSTPTSILIRLFDKDQVGSNREISAMNAVGIVLTKISELAYSLRGKSQTHDLIGNPNKDLIIQAKISKWMSLGDKVKIAFNKDCSRFGPNQIMPKFILHNSLVTADKDTFALISSSSLLMMSKTQFFPEDLARMIRKDRGNHWRLSETKNSSYAKLLRLCLKVDPSLLNTCSVNLPFGMGQGLMGAQASHGHDDAICFRSNLLLNSEKWAGILTYEDYAVTSDDSTLYLAFSQVSGNYTHQALCFAHDDSWILQGFGLLTNTAKSVATTTSPEFNSEFTIKGKPVRAYYKMAHALLDIPSGESPLADLAFPASQGKELLAQGGSVFAATLLSLCCFKLLVDQQNKLWLLHKMEEMSAELYRQHPEGVSAAQLVDIRYPPQLGGFVSPDPCLSLIHPMGPWLRDTACRHHDASSDWRSSINRTTRDLLMMQTQEDLSEISMGLSSSTAYMSGVTGGLIMQARPSSRRKRLMAELGIGNPMSFVEESVSFGNQLAVKNAVVEFQMTTVSAEEDLRADSYFGARLTSMHRDKAKLTMSVPEESYLAVALRHTKFSVNELNALMVKKGPKPLGWKDLGLKDLNRQELTLQHTLLSVAKAVTNFVEWRSKPRRLVKISPKEAGKALFESSDFSPTYCLVRNPFSPEFIPPKIAEGNLLEYSKLAGVMSVVALEKLGRVLPIVKDSAQVLTAEKVVHLSTMQAQTLNKHLSRKNRLFRIQTKLEALTTETAASEVIRRNTLLYHRVDVSHSFAPLHPYVSPRDVPGNIFGIIDQDQIDRNYARKLSRKDQGPHYLPPPYRVKSSDTLSRLPGNQESDMVIPGYLWVRNMNSHLLGVLQGTAYSVQATFSEMLPKSLPSFWGGSVGVSGKVFNLTAMVSGTSKDILRYSVTRRLTKRGFEYTTFMPYTNAIRALFARVIGATVSQASDRPSLPRWLQAVSAPAHVSHTDDLTRSTRDTNFFSKLYEGRETNAKVLDLVNLLKITNDAAWKVVAMAYAVELGIKKIKTDTDTLVLVGDVTTLWTSYEDNCWSMVQATIEGETVVLPVAKFDYPFSSSLGYARRTLPKDLAVVPLGDLAYIPAFPLALLPTQRSRLITALDLEAPQRWFLNVIACAASLGTSFSITSRTHMVDQPIELVSSLAVKFGTSSHVNHFLGLLRDDRQYYSMVEERLGIVVATALYVVVLAQEFRPRLYVDVDQTIFSTLDVELPQQAAMAEPVKLSKPLVDNIVIENLGEVDSEHSVSDNEESSSASGEEADPFYNPIVRDDFRLIRVRADGNCLLRAIHASLTAAAEMGFGEDVPEFETFKADVMLKIGTTNLEDLREFMAFEVVNVNKYYQHLTARAQWTADDFDIVPLIYGRVLGLVVNVVTAEGVQRYNQNAPSAIYIAYNGSDHYDGLVPTFEALFG